MKESEKGDPSSGPWRMLPGMNAARCCFTPCQFAGLVYLCGGQTDTIETYSMETNTFELLSLRLPESSSCISFVYNSHLVTLTDTSTLHISPAHSLTYHTAHPKCHLISNAVCVDFSGQIVFLAYRERVVSLRFDGSEVRKVIK